MSLGEQGEPVHVWLDILPIPEPWRTQGDYRDDQRRSRLLYRVAMASVVVAALSGIATAVSAAAAWRALSSSPVKVECVAPPARISN